MNTSEQSEPVIMDNSENVVSVGKDIGLEIVPLNIPLDIARGSGGQVHELAMLLPQCLL